ncbi:MAG: histidinol-phosphate transaminase [Lentisphaeria bacterium]|jgi:histidinol-phosphate aminotransferase
MSNYARSAIRAVAGYVPGEQPRDRHYIKLNTNENPYPPSPAVAAALAGLAAERLRLYPDPVALELRTLAAALAGLPGPEWVLAGNGSDDLLTIGTRTFVDQGAALAFTEPSYSLYPVLADLQGAVPRPVPLEPAFGLPDDLAEQAGDAPLLFLARPNAPTGNSFPRERMHQLCRDFRGVVWIDEAYADFAADNCLDFVKQYPNVVVSRTFSKSYSLAGLRLGLAYARPELVAEMLKVKDSYNLSLLTQLLGTAALRDQAHLRATVAKVKATRERTSAELARLGCEVIPSESNFLFVRPPRPAAAVFQALRAGGILVRHFPGPRTGDRLRITIGTDAEMAELLRVLAGSLAD